MEPINLGLYWDLFNNTIKFVFCHLHNIIVQLPALSVNVVAHIFVLLATCDETRKLSFRSLNPLHFCRGKSLPIQHFQGVSRKKGPIASCVGNGILRSRRPTSTLLMSFSRIMPYIWLIIILRILRTQGNQFILKFENQMQWKVFRQILYRSITLWSVVYWCHVDKNNLPLECTLGGQ